MPTLHELTNLFDVLPETPLPPPRQRRPPTDATKTPSGHHQTPLPPITEVTNQSVQKSSFLHKFFPWLFPSPQTTTVGPPARKPNPFVALKTGKKIIIIAVVDAGNTSFFRFGQGEFTEWPMI